MPGHGSPPPPDRGAHPGRSGTRLSWQQSGMSSAGATGVEAGFTKHWNPSGAWEDEMGAVETSKTSAGRYGFEATHYDPYERDPRDRDAGWSSRQGEFSVRTPARAKIAGEALLNRMQRGQ